MGVYNCATMRGAGSSWSYGGFFGAGNVEPLLGSLAGRSVLVVGSGRGCFENFERLYEKTKIVFAANDVGVLLPRVDHLVSLHVERLQLWAELRRDETGRPYGNTDVKTHTGHGSPGQKGVDYTWQGLEPILPLSGYFAAQIAYLMGAVEIQLIGCPGDSTPRYWETKANPINEHGGKGIQDMVKGEMNRLPEFKKIIRSTDGWTKEFFGGC